MTPNTQHRARILVPLANAQAVPHLARAAGTLARLMDAEVVLLHVASVPMLAPLQVPDASRLEAERLFASARAHIPAGIRVQTDTRPAHLVGATIRDAAKALAADVVLVGWRSGFTLKSLLQGTLQPILARPPCDVLLVDLDQVDTFSRVLKLPGTGSDGAGMRILAAVADAHATGILLYDAEPGSPAERRQQRERHARVETFLAAHAPTVGLSTRLDQRRRALDRVVDHAGPVRLVLVTPHDRGTPPRVHQRPLTRLEKPLVALVA